MISSPVIGAQPRLFPKIGCRMLRRPDRYGMVPPPWVEMMLMAGYLALAPVNTMLATMRVVSNMNSMTDPSSPSRLGSKLDGQLGWANRVADLLSISANHGSNHGSPR